MLTFIGKDSSMGLKNGKKYKVTIDRVSQPYFLYARITTEHNKELMCPYSSIEAFMKNWAL